jgi:Tol biopolymer transport system component
MTARDDLDRRLAAWFVADAPQYEPEHLLGAVLARTARTRRRPAWLIPERWIPMSTISSAAAAAPRVPWRIVGLAALLAIALVAGAILVAGSQQRHLPAPFGPAANGVVVFVNDGRIYRANADGTAASPISRDFGGSSGGPVASRDGTRVAYFDYPTKGGIEGAYDVATLVVSDLDRRSTDAEGLWASIDSGIRGASKPAWSPDGRWIVYSKLTAGEYADRIFLAAADGSSEPRQIGDPGLMAWAPALSPDGKRIAFVSEAPTSSRLMIMNADGSGVRQLSTGSYFTIGWGMEHGSHGFDWSADGRRIIFSAGAGEVSESGPVTRDLYVVDVDGGARERAIATDPLLEYGATWSPDGTRIAYLRGKDQSYPDLVVAAADGSMETTLARGVSWFTPTWSPDGTKVLAIKGSGSVVSEFDPTGSKPPTNVVPSLRGVTDFSPTSMTEYDWQRVAP